MTGNAFEILGRRLRNARLERRLSRRQLAQMSGIAEARLQGFESGSERIRGSELLSLSRHLGVAYERLFSKLEDCSISPDPPSFPKGQFVPEQLDNTLYSSSGGATLEIGAVTLQIDGSGRIREVNRKEASVNEIHLSGSPHHSPFPRRGVRATWNVRRIELEGLAMLRRLIADPRCPPPFRLCFDYGGWKEETYGNVRSALDRILGLAKFATEPPPNRTAKIVKPVEQASDLKIRWMCSLWMRRLGRLEEDDLKAFSAFSPNIFTIEDGRFGFIGEKTLLAQLVKPEDIADMIGQSSDRDPANDAFAESVVGEYKTVQSNLEPHFDHICAPFHLYGVQRWLLYERLICPFRLPSGRDFLAVVCRPSQSIDVPFAQFRIG